MSPGSLLACIYAFLGAVYAFLLFHFIRGALKLPASSRPPGPNLAPGGPAALPAVSVVVPLRNEEEHAPATLRALAAQDYAGEWEVLCVDDRSTDATGAILAAFAAANPRFRHLAVPKEAPAVPSPKKRALALGFSAAQGEILMTTDADCHPGPGWIAALASRFGPEVGIVQGPKRIVSDGGFLGRYQETEVFGLVSIEAATFALGAPMIASAPSLAYRKALYERAGGFAGLEHFVSGDDDLLVHRMRKKGGPVPSRVAYAADPAACVTTPAAKGFRTLLLQRARWASNGAHYDNKAFVALLLCIYLFYVLLLLAPLFLVLGWLSWPFLLFPFLGKILLDGVFLGLSSRSLGQKEALPFLPCCEILNIPLVVFAVILGHFGWYRWR